MFAPIKNDNHIITFENEAVGIRIKYYDVEDDGDCTQTREKFLPWGEVVNILKGIICSQQFRLQEMSLETKDIDFAEFCSEKLEKIYTLIKKVRKVEASGDVCIALIGVIEDDDLIDDITSLLIL